MVLQTLHQPGPREEPRGALLALTGRLVLVPYKMFSEASAPRYTRLGPLCADQTFTLSKLTFTMSQ